MVPFRPLRTFVWLLLSSACAQGGTEQAPSPIEATDSGSAVVDAGRDAGAPGDAGGETAPGVDAALPAGPDAAAPEMDAGEPLAEDAGSPPDAGHDAGEPDAGAAPFPSDLPTIHDHSGAPRDRVVALVRRALAGLGFAPDSAEGPNPKDRVFVGKRYLAWIDQTGFYGKLNGLFTLNGAAGEALDFVLVDPTGRPVNLFVPGEDGDGAWAPSYKGAEHIEFPNRTPEPNDDASCANGDWCNQYGLNEAPTIRNAAIPWWQSCNVGTLDFAAKFEPVVVEESDARLKLVYEGRLVKEADGDGTYDGDACHTDYLFPDGVRRPVYLRVGYELFGDLAYVDRTLQIRNPQGNPSFDGPMSLIGGFVVSRWPDPHYLKRMQRFWKPETRDVALDWDGTNVTLKAGIWNDLTSYAPSARDVLIAWIDQPLTVSSVAGALPGGTITLSHVGPSDNGDVGACLCSVHGGLELGGGLIHGGTSLPIAGGQSSIEAKRRITVPSAGRVRPTRALTLEAESQLAHGIGRLDGDGWSANTAGDASGHLAYGPYATDWGGGSGQAAFVLLVDDNTYDNGAVVTLEVYDADADRVLSQRVVTRREFRAAGTYQTMRVNFDLGGRAGHRIETRVWWHDIAYVRLDRIDVALADLP